MFTKQEKDVIKNLVSYHLEEVRKDKKYDDDIIALIGAEAKYEAVLQEILKKLK